MLRLAWGTRPVPFFELRQFFNYELIICIAICWQSDNVLYTQKLSGVDFCRMERTTPKIPEGISIFSVNINGERLFCVSFVSPEEAAQAGIADEAIIGIVDSTLSLTPAHFKRTAAFRRVLHQVIARVGPSLPELKSEAQRQGEGFVYLIDARVKDPAGKIEPEDILGAFRVVGGTITSDTYQMNENHRILSENGLFRLHPTIQAELVKELKIYR